MRNKRAAGMSALDLTTRARLLEAWLALTIGLEVPPSHFKNTQGHNILLNRNTEARTKRNTEEAPDPNEGSDQR